MPPQHGALIDAFAAHLARINRSPRTIESYSDTLWAAHRQLPAGLPQALPAEIETWLANPDWSAKTQDTRLAAVKSFFKWAVAHERVTWNPAERIEPPKVIEGLPEPATDLEVATILERVPEPVLTWSMLAAYAGTRAIEVWRMDYADFGEVYVQIHGKGGKRRLVPTHDQLLEHVAGRAGWVAVGSNGQRVASERRVSNYCWKAYHRAGVNIGIHKLRGWFATSMLQAGHDLATVQDLLGHASPVTTRRYAMPSAEQMRAAVLSLAAPSDAADHPAATRRRSPSEAAAPGPDANGSPPPAPPPDPDTARHARSPSRR